MWTFMPSGFLYRFEIFLEGQQQILEHHSLLSNHFDKSFNAFIVGFNLLNPKCAIYRLKVLEEFTHK